MDYGKLDLNNEKKGPNFNYLFFNHYLFLSIDSLTISYHLPFYNWTFQQTNIRGQLKYISKHKESSGHLPTT